MKTEAGEVYITGKPSLLGMDGKGRGRVNDFTFGAETKSQFGDRVFYSATLERDLRKTSRVWTTMQKSPEQESLAIYYLLLSSGISLSSRTHGCSSKSGTRTRIVLST